MKKIGIMIMCVFLVISFAGCSEASQTKSDVAEVYLLAAASLTDALDETIVEFEKSYPEYKIIPTYAASGVLQSQIEEGAPADLFLSAAEKQMNKLEGQGLIDTENRIDFLENKIVLIVPKDSELGLEDFSELKEDSVKTIGLGEFESVPVGQYSKELLENLDLLPKIEHKIVFGNDVRAVLGWVEQGEVDAGIVYSTDAQLAKDKVLVVAQATEEQVSPVIYPMAILKAAQNKTGAKVFFEFLQNEESQQRLVEYGFSVIE